MFFRGIGLGALLLASGCISAATRQSMDEALGALRSEAIAEVGAGGGEPSLTTTGSCDTIARAAANRRPGLTASRERAAAKMAAANAETALPSAELALEVWDFPIGAPTHADREGMYMVHVSQAFTPLGARDARARAMAEEAHEESGLASEQNREAYAEIAHACVDWSLAAAAVDAAAHHRALIVELQEAQLARFASGGTLSDVARVKLELARLSRAEAEKSIRRDAAREALVALVGEGGRVGEQAPSLAVPAESETAKDPPASTLRGSTASAQHRTRAAEARVEAAQAEDVEPEIGVRATYMQAPGERPGLGAMVSTTLPWLWGGGGARVDAARAELRASRAEEGEAQRLVASEVGRARAGLRAAQRSLRELRERELPAVEDAITGARASASASEFDLTAWLEAMHALQDAREEEVQLLGAIAHARVDLASAQGLGGVR